MSLLRGESLNRTGVTVTGTAWGAAAGFALTDPLTTRRASMTFGAAGDATFGAGSKLGVRIPVRTVVPTKRWRVKLANYNFKSAIAGAAFTLDGIWFGEMALDGTGAETSNTKAVPTQIDAPGGVIPGDGTLYVSPWISTPQQQLAPGRTYLLCVGTAAPTVNPTNVFRTSTASYIGFNAAAQSGQTPSLGLAAQTYFDVQIEYEFDAAPSTSVGLFIGDSLSEGQGQTSSNGPAYGAWPFLVGLRQGVIPVVNASSGTTAADWANLSALRWTSRLDVATYAPDFAVVALGANDANLSRTLSQFQADMTAIVGGLRALGIDRIFGVTITPRSFTGGSAQETARTSFNSWLLGRPLGLLEVFDMDTAVKDPANALALAPLYTFGDNTHPAKAGYSRMAGTVDLPRLR